MCKTQNEQKQSQNWTTMLSNWLELFFRICVCINRTFFLQEFTLQNWGGAYTRNLKKEPRSRYPIDD
jgi:hypothetical protein